ncbi:MAG: hypothetical protein IMZ43_12215 [Thermoplasmata archaeon]|nr:hypothetical protein [Thermoplasmata archaeon]
MQVKKLYHTVLKDGGITVTSRLVQVRKQAGFFVSLKNKGIVINLKDFTADELSRQINSLWITLDQFIGVWVDKANEKVYIDISVWILDREKAVQKGLTEGQIAIWDIEKGQEVYLK